VAPSSRASRYVGASHSAPNETENARHRYHVTPPAASNCGQLVLLVADVARRDAPGSSRAEVYIPGMRVLIAVAILAVLTGAMLLLSVAQNDGCLPWQERVGTRGDTFAEVEGNTRCR
jgi:hypothetical protein